MLWDTDVILNRPVSELWRDFDKYVPEGKIFAATEFGPDKPGGANNALCSCMMLLHVARMREAGWVAGNPWMYNQIKNKTDFTPNIHTGSSDQAMYTWVRMSSPHLYGTNIPPKWIGSHCQSPEWGGSLGIAARTPPGLTPPKGNVEWTALHFNCMKPTFHPQMQVNSTLQIIQDFYTDIAKRTDTDLCNHDF
jgi:hypothetical protein